MLRRSPLLLVSLLALGSCRNVLEPQLAPFGEPFWLPFGQTAQLPATPNSIRFVSLLEDSRCPVDELILCMSAGRVRVRIDVAPPMGGISRQELRLLDEPGAAAVGGYLLQLLDVDPPRSMTPAAASSYRLRLMVTAHR